MTVLPLYLLPPVEWYRAGIKAGGFFVSIQEPYAKQTLRNRYRIAGPNGVQALSVPVQADSARGELNQVQIAYAERWLSEHKHACQAAYGKSPFYEFYDYRIWDLFEAKPEHLLELSQPLLERLHGFLQLQDLPLEFVNEPASMDTFPEVGENYPQVFEDRHGFQPGLSVLDLLSNQGPMAGEWLRGGI